MVCNHHKCWQHSFKQSMPESCEGLDLKTLSPQDTCKLICQAAFVLEVNRQHYSGCAGGRWEGRVPCVCVCECVFVRALVKGRGEGRVRHCGQIIFLSRAPACTYWLQAASLTLMVTGRRGVRLKVLRCVWPKIRQLLDDSKSILLATTYPGASKCVRLTVQHGWCFTEVLKPQPPWKCQAMARIFTGKCILLWVNESSLAYLQKCRCTVQLFGEILKAMFHGGISWKNKPIFILLLSVPSCVCVSVSPLAFKASALLTLIACCHIFIPEKPLEKPPSGWGKWIRIGFWLP